MRLAAGGLVSKVETGRFFGIKAALPVLCPWEVAGLGAGPSPSALLLSRLCLGPYLPLTLPSCSLQLASALLERK